MTMYSVRLFFEPDAKGTSHHVDVGDFRTRPEARRALARLLNTHPDLFIAGRVRERPDIEPSVCECEGPESAGMLAVRVS